MTSPASSTTSAVQSVSPSFNNNNNNSSSSSSSSRKGDAHQLQLLKQASIRATIEKDRRHKVIPARMSSMKKMGRFKQGFR